MNNSFLQCISDICGTELSSVVSGGKYSVYGNTVAVVEGHKGIAFYSREKVCFFLRQGILEICGDNLEIRCLEKNCGVICGKILSVAVQNGKK